MKRMIMSASIAQEETLKYARKAYTKAKELLDILEEAPDGFIEELDAQDLYDALIEDIPSIAFAIKSVNQKKRYEDMW